MSHNKIKNHKYSIDSARGLALSRGGKCLSTEYVNNRTKMLWECGNGHHGSYPINRTQELQGFPVY